MTNIDFAKEEFDKIEKLLERGHYYKEANKTKEALKNYIEALTTYYQFAILYISRANAITRRELENKEESQGTVKVYSKVLSDVANLLAEIVGCCDESFTQAFIISKMQLISNQLDKYESYFDAEQLEMADGIRSFVESYKSVLQRHKLDLDQINNKTDQALSSELDQIRSALRRISSTKVCPIEIESLGGGGGGCFIATAAYSTAIHPDLDTFRQFRDEKLLTSFLGQQLVSIYYKIGPTMAEYVEKQPVIQKFLKKQLSRLAEWMRSQP